MFGEHVALVKNYVIMVGGFLFHQKTVKQKNKTSTLSKYT